jgi:hypothetical protein
MCGDLLHCRDKALQDVGEGFEPNRAKFRNNFKQSSDVIGKKAASVKRILVKLIEQAQTSRRSVATSRADCGLQFDHCKRLSV